MTVPNALNTQEILIADAQVKDLNILLAGVAPNVETWLVEPGQDALGLIFKALAQPQMTRLHLLAHGAPGEIRFGGQAVTAADFQIPPTPLLPRGDLSIAFWSCRTGAGAAGQAFVEAVSAATGARVAATSELVGAAEQGGNWDLGVTAPFTAEARAGFGEVLIVSAPTLVTAACSPPDDGSLADPAANIVLTFSEPVHFVGIFLLAVFNSSGLVELFNNTDALNMVGDLGGTGLISGNTLTINPGADLLTGASYFVQTQGTLEGFTDQFFQNINDETTYNFTVGSTPDTTLPVFVSATPADNATDAAAGANLVITFSENIAFGTTGAITVHDVTNNSTFETFTVTDGSAAGAAGGVATINTTALTLNPGSNLLPGTEYSVHFDAGSIVDTATTPNPLAAITNNTTYNFTVPDITPPALDQTPTFNASNRTITVDFNEPVVNALASLDALKAAVTYNEGLGYVALSAGATVALANDKLTITFAEGEFPSSNNVTIQVASGALKDSSNNAMATALISVAIDTKAPVLTGTAINSSAHTMTLTFDEAVSNASTATDEIVKIAQLKAMVTVSANGGAHSALGDDDLVTLAGNQLIITFAADSFAVNTGLKAHVAAGALQDASGNLTADSIAGTGAAPRISGRATIQADENTLTTVVSSDDNDFDLADVDTDNLTVKITAEHGTLALGSSTGIAGTTSGTTILFSGTQADLEPALNSLSYRGDANFSGTDSVTIQVSDDAGWTWQDYFVDEKGLFLNPTNGHYYQYIAGNISWAGAQMAAAEKSLFGLNGYLVTVTSAEENDFIKPKLGGNGWMGASDVASEGTWKWMSGPEAGTTLGYSGWSDGEPNNSVNEDYAEFTDDSGWNDLSGAGDAGYVVEYGGEGFGTLGTATLRVVVNAVNNAPTISGVSTALTLAVEGTAVALDDFTVADAENDDLTVTLTPENGVIGGLTDVDTNVAGIQLTGEAATINTALAGATFTVDDMAASAKIDVVVTDSASNTVTATYDLTTTSSLKLIETLEPALDWYEPNLADGIVDANEVVTFFTVALSPGAAAGQTVELLLGETTLQTITLTANHISGDLPVEFMVATDELGADGSKSLSAKLKNGADTIATAPSLAFVLDATSVGAPTLEERGTTHLEDFNLGATEAAARTTIRVTLPTDSPAVPNDTLELLLEGVAFSIPKTKVLTDSDIDVNGYVDFVVTLADLGDDGRKSLSAHITDQHGNVSRDSDLLNFTLDTVAPDAPTLTEKTGSTDLADDRMNSSEAVTTTFTVSLTDTSAETGDEVALLLNGSAFTAPKTVTLTDADITANAIDFIVLQSELGADGATALTATVIDDAGNSSDASNPLLFDLDTTAPTFLNSAPADAGTIPLTSNIALFFDEALDSDVTGVTFSTAAEIAVVHNLVTINPTANLVDGTTYTVNWAGLTDLAGNPVTAGSASFTADGATPSLSEEGSDLDDGALNPAEGDINIRVTLPTNDTLAVADDELKLLLAGAAFGTPKTMTLTDTEITQGYYDFTVTQADLGADGGKSLTAQIGTGTASAPLTFTKDTTAPAAPSAPVEFGSSDLAGGKLNADEAISTTFRVTLPNAGSIAAAGDSIDLLLDGTPIQTVTLTTTETATKIGTGRVDFTVLVSDLGADGTKLLTAKITDAAGNVGAAGTALTFDLDATAPSAPTLTESSVPNEDAQLGTAALSAAQFHVGLSGTGAVAGDSVELLQWSEPFATAKTVTLTSTHITNGYVEFTGLTPAAFGSDDYQSLTARITDLAGNISDETATPLIFTLDTVAPTFEAATITADSDSNTSYLDLRFNEELLATGLPAADKFVVKVGSTTLTANTNYTIAADAVDNEFVTLTFASCTFAATDVVTVTYTDPADNQTTGVLQDLAGNDVATLTATASFDSDGNGISDIEEGGSYDGDGDGTADSAQDDVSSLKTEDGSYLTFETANGSKQENVSVSPAPSNKELPAALQGSQFPLGVLSFDVTLPAGATQQTISVYLDAKQTVNGYIKKDKDGNWVSVPIKLYEKDATGNGWHEVALGTKVTGDKQRIDFVVTDNGALDRDSTVGKISDPGGPTLFANTKPVITSNGGGDTAAISIAENTTAVTTVVSTDTDVGDTRTYSVTGGDDKAKFSIVSTTGVLTFASAPDFENPTDVGSNNTYVAIVTATDTHGGTDTQTVTVTVTDVAESSGGTGGGSGGGSYTPPTNYAPTGSVTISGSAIQGQTLTAANTLADANGLGTISYQWLADGVAITDAKAGSYTLTAADLGKTITVAASYIDGASYAERVTSVATMAVVATPAVTTPTPVTNHTPTGAVTITGSAVQGQTLAVTNTLADADGLGGMTYVWMANGTATVTAKTYTLTQADVGKIITVVANYTDSASNSERVFSTATAAVANVNDLPTGVVTISGNATQGQTLTATNMLADIDGLGTIGYQWLADGVAISGAVADTFILTPAQTGKTITVAASYIDTLSTPEQVVSLATPTVAPLTNHIPTGAVTISGIAQQGQTLTAANSLADADGLGTIGYQWLANGTAISGAVGNTLTLAQAEVGKTITVAASYTDTLGAKERVVSTASATVANVNDLPTGIVTISGSAQQGQTLTAANTLADVDGLGTIGYQWLANGTAITGAVGNTLTLAQAEVGKTITVAASYTDTLGAKERVVSTASATVANVNDLPTGAVTISGAVKQGQTLTAANTLADVDGLGAISYQWLANGTAITGAVGKTFALTAAQIGKTITVAASYTDKLGTAEQVVSTATPAVVKGNTLPTATNGTLTAVEDTAYHFTVANFNFRDADAGDTLAKVQITTLPTKGVLAYSSDGLIWTTVIRNQIITTADIDAGHLRFTPAADDNGVNYVSIGFKVSDGIAFSSAAYTLKLNVTAVAEVGTPYDDTLQGSAHHDEIDGLAGNDVIAGLAGNDTLIGGLGNDTLRGGMGRDSLSGGDGSDTYYIDNTGDKVIETNAAASGGIDRVYSGLTAYTLTANVETGVILGTAAANLTGNTLDNLLIGNGGANILLGNAGNDSLNGGTGNDTLNGGVGSDLLNGGTGKDVFQFSAALIATNVDKIVGFSTIDDRIMLKNAIFKKLDISNELAAEHFHASTTGTAHDSNDFVLYNSKSGALLYDADGSGAEAAIQFAIIGVGLALTATDFVVS